MNKKNIIRDHNSLGGFVAVLALVLFFIGYIFLLIDGDGAGICATPFGANDFRCVGYFQRR